MHAQPWLKFFVFHLLFLLHRKARESLCKGQGVLAERTTALAKGLAMALRNNKGKARGSGTVSNARR